MFVQGAAEDRVNNKDKMFRSLVLVDETEKGDMNSPARLLDFTRWCRVLGRDVSLRIREGRHEESSGG